MTKYEGKIKEREKKSMHLQRTTTKNLHERQNPNRFLLPLSMTLFLILTFHTFFTLKTLSQLIKY